VRSLIEIARIFSLVGTLTNLKRCTLQIDNLDKLIFLNKNWPNDPRVGSYLPCNLIELIEVDASLEEEYEGKFELDELVDM